MKFNKLLFFLLIISTALWSLPLQAAWSQDPAENNPVCLASGSQQNIQILSDGAGGVFISWIDQRQTNGQRIYVQRLDAQGDPVWTVDGISLSTATDLQNNNHLAGDGAGGVIVSWTEGQVAAESHLFAQRLDSDGNTLWAPDGVAVSNGVMRCLDPLIIGDGAGGAILVWEAYLESQWRVYAQRLDAPGNRQWAADGLLVRVTEGPLNHSAMVSDQAGGGILLWAEGFQLRAQRLDGGGAFQWPADGIVVCPEAIATNWPQMISDSSGGAIICWHDERSVNGDVYAQRLDASGTRLWSIDGVPVCTDLARQTHPRLQPDGAGGAIIAWSDHRNSPSNELWAQRLDADGIGLWPMDGVLASVTADYPVLDDMVSDGAGGVILAWTHEPSMYQYEFAGQRLDADGTIQWDSGGLEVCAAQYDQSYPRLVSDMSGGAIFVWPDKRNNGDGDIYAQQVDANGNLGGEVYSTISADLSCSPDTGVLPFDCQVTGSLNNEYADYHRRLAATVTVYLPNGEQFSDYKRGYTNLAPASSHHFSWTEHLTSNEMVGTIEAYLFVQDVTPTPYNQPPYPPSGAMVSESCVVEVLEE